MARSFYDVLTAAVNDIETNGFDSAERVAYWSEELRRAADSSMAGPEAMEDMLREAMAAIYRRMIERGGIVKYHPGVGRFTLDKVRPQLRAELDRRIMASASLIKLNRQQAIERTLQRFQGWSTSIPKGGSDTVDKRETKAEIRKALAQLSFETRRVIIDQGHKFVASLNETLARGGDAIAAVWKSHWRQAAGYRFRPDHKERDGRVYALRGSWAVERGLMKAGPAGFYEDITAVAQEPFCRCVATFVYALGALPDDMLTAKGRAELERVRVEISS